MITDTHARFPGAEYDAHKLTYALQRPHAPIDLHVLHGFPAPKRAGQSAQAEDMVEMPVRQQDVVQPLEANAAAQELPLGAFAAIDQEAVFAVNQHRCRQPTLCRRSGGGGAEKDQFEHETTLAIVLHEVRMLREA